jgi:hypothetical protein
MPGRSMRHQPSSLLLGLPQDLRIAEGVHVAGRGQWQYDVVEMADQRGVSAFAREGRACAPLLDLAHLG